MMLQIYFFAGYLSEPDGEHCRGEENPGEHVNWTTSNCFADGREDCRRNGEAARIDGDASEDEHSVCLPFSLHVRNCGHEYASCA